MEKLFIATSFDKRSNLIQIITDLGIVENVITTKEELQKLNKKTILLLSWKHILSEEILTNQKLVLNLHNSLLPKYRGRHAFTWALINGEKKSGFTLHKVVREIDAGPIYDQCEVEIDDTDDINDLFVKANLVVEKWLPNIILKVLSKQIKPVSQDNTKATYFRKRTLVDMELNTNSSKLNVSNFIRAHTPPYTKGAYIIIDKSIVYLRSVLEVKPLNHSHNGNTFIKKNRLILNCKDAQVIVEISKIDQL